MVRRIEVSGLAHLLLVLSAKARRAGNSLEAMVVLAVAVVAEAYRLVLHHNHNLVGEVAEGRNRLLLEEVAAAAGRRHMANKLRPEMKEAGVGKRDIGIRLDPLVVEMAEMAVVAVAVAGLDQP